MFFLNEELAQKERRVRERGKLSTGVLNKRPSSKERREGGRLSTELLKREYSSKVRNWIFGGKSLTDPLNEWPKERWVSEGGREESGCLKSLPKTRCVILGGSRSGKLKISENLRYSMFGKF